VLVCSVYGVPCAEGDELVMAAVVAREGASIDPAELFAFLESQPDLFSQVDAGLSADDEPAAFDAHAQGAAP
jgi:hypothetical protein